jgi:superfamily II DNA or RNA helicase
VETIKPKLDVGAYFSLHTQALESAIVDAGLKEKAHFKSKEQNVLVDALVQSFTSAFKRHVLQELEKKKSDETAIARLQKIFKDPQFLTKFQELLPIDDQILLEIKRLSADKELPRPVSEINESAILVPDGSSPHLGHQIVNELKSCDRAEWLVSFIKRRAIIGFYEDLKNFCATPAPDGGPRLRIVTTTYMGASDVEAIKLLMQLPNTEVRMSFDDKSTRLHAKAYLFHRKTGFSTAYIGSANLSTQAMSTGLEWTVKVTESEMEHLWDRAVCAFQQSWEDTKKFEPVSVEDLEKIGKSLSLARGRSSSAGALVSTPRPLPFTLQPHRYQEVVLEALMQERQAKRFRHLVIAATGTGKTMIAAFYYRLLCRQKGIEPSFVFIAHRKDILEQALWTYRHVIGNMEFGVLAGEGDLPPNSRHFFCTPETWKNKLQDLGKTFFETIVIDECHHAAAQSYDGLIQFYNAAIDENKCDLLGLTATPDREDGKSIVEQFGGGYTHEISLSDAINRGHLVPFEYFAVQDVNVNFTSVNWGSKAEAERQIQNILQNNRARAENVIRELYEHVTDVSQMRAIGFCAGIKHAQLMADCFNEAGISAVALQGKDSTDVRLRARDQLKKKDVNIIFVADLFNEGVDIPSVDTLLMLRPTDSATIFTQQLGRGLRLSEDTGKESLLVLDFVARHNERFKGDRRFNILTTQRTSLIGLYDQIKNGMPFLPLGCSISLSAGAQEVVLANIKAYIARLRGQRLIHELTDFVREKQEHQTFKSLMKHLELETPEQLLKQKVTPQHITANALEGGYDTELAKKDSALFLRVMENDDVESISYWIDELEQVQPRVTTVEAERIERFNLVAAVDTKLRVSTHEDVWNSIWNRPQFKNDLLDLLYWKKDHLLPREDEVFTNYGTLKLHHRYSRKQIMAALGKDGVQTQQGLEYSKDQKYVALFITRHKDERRFSPTTMYKDYAISTTRFHWESQAHTTVASKKGKMLIQGSKIPLLFVQEEKTNEYGAPRHFIFLGEAKYVSHQKECPIQVIWDLKHAMPAEVFEWAR